MDEMRGVTLVFVSLMWCQPHSLHFTVSGVEDIPQSEGHFQELTIYLRINLHFDEKIKI